MLAPGTRLRFDDLTGDACAHVLVYNALEPWERLNVADTVKIPWQAYLGDGPPAAVRRRPGAGDDRRRHLRPARRVLRHVSRDVQRGRYGDGGPAGPLALGPRAVHAGGGQARPGPPRPAAERVVLPGRARRGRTARSPSRARPGPGPRRAARRAAAAGCSSPTCRTRSTRAPTTPSARCGSTPGAASPTAPGRPAVGRHARAAPRLPEHRRLLRSAGAVIDDRAWRRARTSRCWPTATVPSGLGRSSTVPVGATHAPEPVLDRAGASSPGPIVLDERSSRHAPWSAVVRAGQVLTIVDVGGNQSADCLLYDAARHRRALQRAGHDRRAGQRLRPRPGRVLRIERGQAADDRGRQRDRPAGHDRRRVLQGVEHPALRPPHVSSTAAGRTSSPRAPGTASARATWSPTSTGS